MSIGDMLQAQVDSEDAARYRWLRDHAQWDVMHRLTWYMPYFETSLDKAIDAARAADSASLEHGK